MTRRRTSIRAKLILSFLVVMAISILPSTARAQTCGSPGVTTQVTNFSVAPSSIIAASGLATLTLALSCTVATNTAINFSYTPMNGGSIVEQTDPNNPCACIPAGSSSGTIKLYGTQVTATTAFVLTAAYGSPQAQTTLTVNPLIAALTISPNTIVGASNQYAVASVTLNGPMLHTDSVAVACPYPGCYPFNESKDYIQIPAGNNSCTQPAPPQQPPVAPLPSDCITITAGNVPQPTPLTFLSFYKFTDLETTATITVTPNFPTVTVSPSSIQGGLPVNLTASFTLTAPVGPSGGTVAVAACYGSPPLCQFGPFFLNYVNLTNGQQSGSVQFADPQFVITPNNIPDDTLFACYGAECGTTTFMVTRFAPPPASHPADQGSSGGGCNCFGGAPINLTNGNVLIQQRDYSLPGLGGGLELVRTWNSHWQDASPVSVLGMFGHSWRSTYEERFSFPDSNTVMYWRADGSGWTFSYNSATQAYAMVSPPNEHASLSYNSVAGQYALVFADGSQRIFNQPGYLAAIIDRNGNQTTVSYDSGNRITQVTDAAGRQITFSYNDPVNTSQATSAQDSTGVFGTYVYDSGGRLTQVTYADNSTLNFAYDANSSITSVTDTNGKLLEAHTYDSAHNGLTSTRAFGADQVTLTYSATGQTQLSDSMGNITTYGYQTIGGRNFANSVSGPGCASCGGRGNQTLSYDGQGNVATSTDALSNITSFTYDANGNVLTKSVKLNASTTFTWTYTYNQFQEVLTAQDPMGNTTTNTYDAKGNLLSTTTPSPDGVKPGSATTFAYDSKGELTTVTDPRGNATTIAYTPAGLIASVTDAQGNATTFAYDARGNRTSSTDTLNNTTNFTYDVMNRLTQITQPDGTKTSFAYDTRGRRISVTDANGKTTAYGYDDDDRLLSVTDAAGNLTAYGYDTENHLQAITDAANHVTNFAYDPLGRVTQVTFPSTLSESYNYDAVGNLLTKTDRKGQKITYSYDNLYRLSTKTYPDSTAVTYSYDALSRLTQASDPSGTYAFAYDNLGRLTGTTTNYSFLTSRTVSMSYGYDAASNRTSFTDAEGGVTNYAYDSLNRLTGLTDFNSGAFNFGYDALGRRTNLTRPNAVTTSYRYDSLSRLLAIIHQSSAFTGGTSYAYDASGNRTSRTDTFQPTGGSVTQTLTNYGYDAIYELTQAVVDGSTAETYSYDAVGNRLSSLGVPSYSYNSSNELTSASPATFTYDANGNMTGKTAPNGTTTYAWDFENRLTSVTLPKGSVLHYQYDPFGRRIFSDGTGRIFVYDGDNVIEDLDLSGKTVARYTQGLGIDEPLEETASGASSYYEAEGLGSVTSLTNASGAVANTYNYDSFGNQTASTGSVSNRFFFTARESVAKTGLYYYRARYYDPTAGRFLSEDPLRSSNGTIDLYQYAENNPISFEDPTGLEACRKPAQCFAQLKYRPVNDWRAKIAGATHAFWYVQGSDGKQYILSSGPTGASGNGSLNVWRNSNVNNGADNTSATTWWNSGISSVNCAGVDKMIQAATRWPENQIPYSWSGPNSNSAAHDLGTIGGFNPPAPPGSVGWGAPIPKSH